MTHFFLIKLYQEKRQNSTLLLVAENKSDKQVNKKDLTSD